MDWSECEFVERVEGVCGGRQLIVGTRVWPETFTDHAEYGYNVEEMHDLFPTVSVEQIRGVLSFAKRKQSAA